MKRFLLAFAAFATFALLALTLGVAVATADDPKPAQQAQSGIQGKALFPIQPAGQPKAALPAQGVRVTPVTAARLATLEEELETLEAHRDVRKAHVKAAE